MSDGANQFELVRTECACRECIINCMYLPGFMVPADLEKICEYLGDDDLVSFVFKHLLASPGATVLISGEIFQIPTITPARKADGSCHFLENDRCTVHSVSPFGCRFFDHTQSKEAADEISMRGLVEIARAWQRGDLYARLWLMLHEAGRIAPSPIEARARMRAALYSEK